MTRKFIVLQALLGLLYFTGRAQSFFYVEQKDPVGNLLRQKLDGAGQFVIDSRLASDFIIRADFSYKQDSKKFTVSMQMLDTMSLKTVLEAREEYPRGSLNHQAATSVRMALQSLLEKNMSGILTVCRRSNGLLPMNNNRLKQDHI